MNAIANQEHFNILVQEGNVEKWNRWRKDNPNIGLYLNKADLRGAELPNVDFSNSQLRYANFSEANLHNADFRNAELRKADFSRADLSNANFNSAYLSGAKLFNANLSNATFTDTYLGGSDLKDTDLNNAYLYGANLSYAKLNGANLHGANLFAANFSDADLSNANLHDANLIGAQLVRTNLSNAVLTDCSIFGVSAWGVTLDGAEQKNLVVTPYGEPTITVDNLEVAQFIYLLLNNQSIRSVINTITSKTILILGRFTPDRKHILDALRDELRKHNYLPILFDFKMPDNRDVTETITLLARMARFIIADLTEPSSIPKELEAIIPTLAVPVQPLLEGSSRPYSMFPDYWKYDWVLGVHRYDEREELLASLRENIINSAEAKVIELEKRRDAASQAIKGLDK